MTTLANGFELREERDVDVDAGPAELPRIKANACYSRSNINRCSDVELHHSYAWMALHHGGPKRAPTTSRRTISQTYASVC